ncbi:photosynthetic reaction center H subunit [Rhodoblastus acidophilus]|uniref:photosynthetic reaction center subunit H n=1 Tax=Rhodoblastus acidophilus TaxID=1074 RepID=UPI001622A7E5|nr:photosynthetic reaction center subunit H [Rhodoblastus acidophilus]MCW2282303.1 photosynthetic reaction center H subunit [Rhodoblastus acidophilus]MCW2331292.1 photosynthetic reaction center H subunit [Rhodoblastus acidophilus]
MVHASALGHLDVAQLAIWGFWIFFGILVWYLRQEDRREGYPLVNDATGKMKDRGFLYIPEPKTFAMPDGTNVLAPNCKGDERPVNGVQVELFPGAPIEPKGNPLAAGVGPGSWNVRPDVPAKTLEGQNLVAPLRVATHFAVPAEQKSPVGFKVIAADGKSAGTVKDLWVDRGESQVRYFELSLDTGGVVLAPVCFVDVYRGKKIVKINALTAKDFAGVPRIKSSDSITMQEEEKVAAYYGAGTLYATPDRAEPIL